MKSQPQLGRTLRKGLPGWVRPAAAPRSGLTGLVRLPAAGLVAMGLAAAGLLAVAPAVAHATVTAAPAVTSAAPAGAAWSVVPAPDAKAPQDQLSAVSCASARACIAVGQMISRSGSQVRLAERWDGVRWVIKRAPGSGSLSGVSCTSARACMAVGGSLAERWDGVGWVTEEVPGPGGLTAVSCRSATACVAVGGAVVESWNGASWAVQATISDSASLQLAGVSCTSARACVAVGTDNSGHEGEPAAVTAIWNGTTWTLNYPAWPFGPAALNAVSCTSARACTAVGSKPNGEVAERWNGRRWAIQYPPGGGSLNGVSCPSARFCVAVGGDLAERWNGSKWALQRTAGPGNAGLAGVSCTSARACTAAGGYIDTARGGQVTLAEHWNGTSWAVQRSAGDPAGPQPSSLNAVSCTSARACTAVGSFAPQGYYPPPSGGTLAEHWNGRTWVIQRTPNPPHAKFSRLSGVSCSSATSCTAVGSRADNAATLAEHWNGRTWVIQRTPNPARADGSELSGVSCPSARFCIAVGHYYSEARGGSAPLAERWNGSKWAIQRAPGSGYLTGVSCPAARFCIAVGSVAERWNGSTWVIQHSAEQGGPVGVSCTSARACTAVGYMAERWNGRTWVIQPAPLPAGSPGYLLAAGGVSCGTLLTCTAAGYYNNVTLGPQALVEHWNGTTWEIQLTPEAGALLLGVSCTPRGGCIAVGSNDTGTQVIVERRP